MSRIRAKERAKRTPKRPKRLGAPAAHQPERRFPVLLVVFSSLAVLLVLAIILTGGDSLSDDERVAQVAGTPTITGSHLPLYAHGLYDYSIGMVAPTIDGTDFAGRVVSIERDGTPKVALFLAHWCPHCQAEVPRVQAWLAATGGVPGVEFVSVVTGYDPPKGNWSPEDWLVDEGWTMPVIRDDADSSTYFAFGAGGFPFWVFLNRDGTVSTRISGEIPIEELIGILDALAAS